VRFQTTAPVVPHAREDRNSAGDCVSVSVKALMLTVTVGACGACIPRDLREVRWGFSKNTVDWYRKTEEWTGDLGGLIRHGSRLFGSIVCRRDAVQRGIGTSPVCDRLFLPTN